MNNKMCLFCDHFYSKRHVKSFSKPGIKTFFDEMQNPFTEMLDPHLSLGGLVQGDLSAAAMLPRVFV